MLCHKILSICVVVRPRGLYLPLPLQVPQNFLYHMTQLAEQFEQLFELS